jgi:hypothetical protein
VEYFAFSTLYEKLHLANFENLKPSDKAKNNGKHKEQQAYIYHSFAVSKLQWIFSCGEISPFLTHTKDLKSKYGRNSPNFKK